MIKFLRGLPASGKSTWAKDYILYSPNKKIIRVNKDDIRSMIVQPFNKDVEQLTVSLERGIVEKAVSAGYEVVIDNTNFNPKHLKDYTDVYGAKNIEVKDFDVPLEECILRDSKREKPVGAKVITDMYDKYVGYKVIKDYSLLPALLVDIDGTIATKCDRDIYDYSKVINDYEVLDVSAIVKDYKSIGHKIIVMSGRDDDSQEVTEQWLKNHHIPYDEIHMRKTGDKRDDAIVKRELFDEFVRGKYNIHFVLDDRDRVVKMWRDLGLTCLQVNYGNF